MLRDAIDFVSLLDRHAMIVIALAAAALGGSAATAEAQQPLRIIAFGAHPDDCDIRAGGTAAKWAALGHKVRFVAVTNGDAGHQSEGGGALAKRRRAEAEEAGRRIGIEYIVLDNHDGELLPTLKVREEIIRQIREWNADLVLGPRPNDYHPDHRYTGVLLQDAAFMVTVPNIAPDTPALRKNPVYDHFKGKQWWRACDNKSFQDMWIGRGRGPGQTKGEWGLLDLVAKVSADEKYDRTCAEKGHA